MRKLYPGDHQPGPSEVIRMRRREARPLSAALPMQREGLRVPTALALSPLGPGDTPPAVAERLGALAHNATGRGAVAVPGTVEVTREGGVTCHEPAATAEADFIAGSVADDDHGHPEKIRDFLDLRAWVRIWVVPDECAGDK